MFLASSSASSGRRELNDKGPTAAELLEKWREATRAAELAAQLADIALATAEQSERTASVSADIAKMAERAARAADRASTTARRAAKLAKELATENRLAKLRQATDTAEAARLDEADARERYHEAEAAARQRMKSGD
jgi:methyl-accepting chemotaxis protein